MRLGGSKRMKTGAWGTDASVLQTLADEVSTLHGLDGAPDALAIRLTKHSGATQ